MIATLQNRTVKAISLKAEKHFKVFEMIVNSFAANYFTMADVYDLENIAKLTVMMAEDEEIMSTNKAGTSTYDKAATRWMQRGKLMLQYKTNLRISPMARFQPNRGSESPAAPTGLENTERAKILEQNPFDSGTPSQ